MKHTAYHHKNLRNELIEKGIELVEEYGMQQLSLRKVAQACNVSHAAPYSHFKNKDYLILAMQSYITDQFTERLQDVIAKHSGKPEFLMEFGKAYVLFFLQNPHYFSFLFTKGKMQINLDNQGESDEDYKPFSIYKKQVMKLLAPLELSEEKKQDYIIALFAYIHGLTSLATLQNVRYASDWEEKIEDLICTFSIGNEVVSC